NTDGAGSIQFDRPSYTIDENAGTATITVTRTGGDLGGVTVAYATGAGTAKDGTNLIAESGTLTFGVGDATKSFTILIRDDHVVPGDLSLELTLSQPTGGAALGAQSTASVTIHNTDGGGTVQFDRASYVVNEDAGYATITVTRSGGDAGGVTVAYATSDNSAEGGTNYSPQSGTLMFGVRENSKSFKGPVLDDGQFNRHQAAGLT